MYGDGGRSYSRWAANMALSQNIGVPWIMCQQYDAPDNVVMVHILVGVQFLDSISNFLRIQINGSRPI